VTDLYIFADKVGSQSLKRELLNKWFKLGKAALFCIPPIVTVRNLYQRTTPTCVLRKLWIAMHVWKAGCHQTEIDTGFATYRVAAMYCPELAADMMCEFLAQTRGKKRNPFNDTIKEFYEPAMLEK
jgi:hypothetical protein